MAIKIDFASDVTGVVRGTADIADRLDQVADSVADLGRDGAKAGDRLADAMKDPAVESARLEGKLEGAQAAADRLSRRGGDAFRNLAEEARESGKKTERATRDGMDGGSEAVETFKDEAKSNLSEVTSSFSGDMDSAVDLVQGTLGGLVADLGPAGLVGGAVAALGIGLAKAMAEGSAEKINEIGEAASDMAGRIREAGGDLSKVDFASVMEEWGLAIQDTREWWELWQDSAKTGAEVIAEKAKDAGVSFETAFKGSKGSLQDSRTALNEVKVALDQAEESATRYVDASTGMVYTDTEDRKRIDALRDLKGRYEDNIKTQESAAETNRLLEAAGIKTAESIEREAAAAKEAEDAITDMAAAMDEAAGANMDADKAQLDWIDTLNTATEDIRTNGQTVDINTAAGRANRQTLLDLAASANDLVAAQVAQGKSTGEVTATSEAARESFIKQAQAAGYTRDEAAKLADQYGLIPKNVDTQVKAHNVAETRKEIDGVAAPRTAPVKVEVDPSSELGISRWISGIRPKIYADVMPRPGSPALGG